jgi:hypothetical protein
MLTESVRSEVQKRCLELGTFPYHGPGSLNLSAFLFCDTNAPYFRSEILTARCFRGRNATSGQ